ncbi:MAG: amino acid permease, partial [Verrucomicrobiales bacterium]|nr:amino acid permease [Verrucomicrobiales bacterium]
MQIISKQLPKIGTGTAIAIVVANMVGTGIFGSLGYQVASLPSGFPVLLLWLIGGVISICGALCYAELAAMFPRSGGEYQLLNSCWPKIVGFLSGWISITAGFTAPIALNAVLMGKYMEAITGW